jgi:hypothetical protein
MITKKKIITAIKRISEKYPQDASEEHIVALVELYGHHEVKEFKKIVVNQIKDLLEQPHITHEDIQSLLENVLAIPV